MTVQSVDLTRYGVYLRPSPEFGRLVAEAFDVLKRQFGLREAGSYPPHVTLVGSIALDPSVSEEGFLDELDAALAGAPAITVVNGGIVERPGDGIGYELGSGESSSFTDLAGTLMNAVAPLRVYPDGDWDAPLRRRDSPERYRPHLTLAGRELEGEDDLREEVHDFLVGAGFCGPSTFRGDTVTAYRLHAPAWTCDYWKSMSWEIMRSWRLS